MGISIWQLLVVVLIAVLFFGTKRLPNVMEDLAKGIKSFKKGLKDEEDPKALAQDRKEQE
ncbi:MAG: twin-arginine translocase TatA/TatE family subunit [Micavibrio sp.]